MAVPKYFEMYHSFLRALSDRKVHTLKDIKEQVIRDFELTEEEMAQMLPSGRGCGLTGWDGAGRI